MKISGRWILFLGAVLILGCETTKPSGPPPQIYKGASFDVEHPPFVTVAAEQGDEFAVHYFRIKNSKNMLGIYEGQRPKLFSKKERDLTVLRRGNTSRENIERGDDAWGVDSNGKIWRESVWSCSRVIHGKNGKTYRIPSMLHLWYFGATDEEAAVYDAIADSLEMLD